MGSVNPNAEQIQAMLASAGNAGAINMINLLRFRARASYPEDHECARENFTGEQAYQLYMAGTAPFIAKVGARILWTGTPNLTIIGPADEHWDLAFIVEYPSMGAMLSMLSDPDYQKIGIHRTAALEDSRLIRCTPRALG